MNPAFLHEIQRLVVAQVCDCFDTVKSSAADALAEVLASYIKEIGRAAHECADVAGRTDVNIGDVLSALDAVGAKFQTIVRDAESLEVPFAHAQRSKLLVEIDCTRIEGESSLVECPFLGAEVLGHISNNRASTLCSIANAAKTWREGERMCDPGNGITGKVQQSA